MFPLARSARRVRSLVTSAVLLGALCGFAPASGAATPPATTAAQAADWTTQGIAASQAKNYARAEACFAQAARLDPQQVQYAVNLALTQVARTRYAQAVDGLMAALTAIHDPAARARLRGSLADAHEAWAQDLHTKRAYAAAWREYGAALAINRAAQPKAAVLDLVNRSKVSFALHRPDQALSDTQQAVTLAATTGDAWTQGIALAARASVEQSRTRYPQAAADARQATGLFQQAADPVSEGLAWQALGESEFYLHGYQAAADCYTKALEKLRAGKDSEDEAGVLADWGGACWEISHLEEAIGYDRQALAIPATAKNPWLQSSLWNSLGNCYDGLGQYGKAQQSFQRTLSVARALGDGVSQGMALMNIAWSLDRAGRPAAALGYYQQTLDLQKRIGDLRTLAYTLGDMGVALQHLGRFREAIAYYDRSLPLLRQSRERRMEGRILDWRGWAFAGLNKQTPALADMTQGLSLSRAVRDGDGEALTLTHLMSACRTHGEKRLAIFYGKQAVNAYQRIRTNIQTLDAAAQKTFVQSNAGAYRELADLLIGEGRLPEAQQVLGLLKQQEYFDFIRRDSQSAPAQGQADLSSQEADWQARYAQIADGVTTLGAEKSALQDTLRARVKAGQPIADADKARLAALTQDLTVANQAFQKFLAQLQGAFDTPAQASDRVQTLKDAVGLQSDLRQLGSGVVALYTLVGKDKYRVLIVTPDTQKAEEYPIGAAALRAKVAQFQQALKDPRVDPRPLARQMYAILFCGGKVEQDLKGAGAQTLMWSLDDALRYLPMAALSPDGTHYLLEAYQNVVFTPVTNARLKDPVSPHWTALGLGVSQAHSVKDDDGKTADFPALPGVAAEMRGVIGTQTGGVLPGTVQMDAQFTEAAMTGALQIGGYPLVHIASHFRLRPGNETDSYLLLGDGTGLSLAEINKQSGLFSGVELLTLSACNTGAGGGSGDGHEVEGFGVLAQRLGAEAVLASLWEVADASTPLLMQGFYKAREAQPGTTKASALQSSQLALLRGAAQVTNPEGGNRAGRAVEDAGEANRNLPVFTPDPKAPYAHPYYWAPFVLIGNWK